MSALNVAERKRMDRDRGRGAETGRVALNGDSKGLDGFIYMAAGSVEA